jgi:hypothetical protein
MEAGGVTALVQGLLLLHQDVAVLLLLLVVATTVGHHHLIEDVMRCHMLMEMV